MEKQEVHKLGEQCRRVHSLISTKKCYFESYLK